MNKNAIYLEKNRRKFPEKAQNLAVLAESLPSWQAVSKTVLILLAIFTFLFIAVNADISRIKNFLNKYIGQDVVNSEAVSQEWINQYNIVITDKLSSKDDSDGDGLSFAKEEAIFTNPFKADTDGDGVSDGEEFASGTNPLGSGELDSDRDKIPDVWENQYSLNSLLPNASADADADELSNFQEYIHGTNPLAADTDSDGYTDAQEISNGYDPDAPGDAKPQVTVLIGKIKVAAPMIWSQEETEAAMQKDLLRGVVRYPKAGVPGQLGNLIISGHSSNYVWVKGDYNSIFKDLGKINLADQVTVRVTQENGKTFDYAYKITEKQVVKADNPWIFQDSKDASVLTLSTCWPVGTNLNRLVLRGELQIKDPSSI